MTINPQALARRGTAPMLPPPPASITQTVAREDVPPPAFVDPNPQVAAQCLSVVAPQPSEASKQAWAILMDALPPHEAIKIASELMVSFQFRTNCNYRGQEFSYKGREDPFHQRILEFICNFVMVKAMALQQEEPEKRIAAELSRSSIMGILRDLGMFRNQFPDLYATRNYHEDMLLLLELLRQYNIGFTS